MNEDKKDQETYETGLENLSNQEVEKVKQEILKNDDPNRPITKDELKGMMEWLKRARNK